MNEVASLAPAAMPAKVEDRPAPSRADALRARLLEEARRFSFFAVMRLLEAVHPEQPRFGQSIQPKQDLLRLGQEPSVIHAPSELAGFEAGSDGRPDRLKVNFFGLFGPDGPLPLHLTEYARDRRRNNGDRTFQSFVDLVPPPHAFSVLSRLGQQPANGKFRPARSGPVRSLHSRFDRPGQSWPA